MTERMISLDYALHLIGGDVNRSLIKIINENIKKTGVWENQREIKDLSDELKLFHPCVYEKINRIMCCEQLPGKDKNSAGPMRIISAVNVMVSFNDLSCIYPYVINGDKRESIINSGYASDNISNKYRTKLTDIFDDIRGKISDIDKNLLTRDYLEYEIRNHPDGKNLSDRQISAISQILHPDERKGDERHRRPGVLKKRVTKKVN